MKVCRALLKKTPTQEYSPNGLRSLPWTWKLIQDRMLVTTLFSAQSLKIASSAESSAQREGKPSLFSQRAYGNFETTGSGVEVTDASKGKERILWIMKKWKKDHTATLLVLRRNVKIESLFRKIEGCRCGGTLWCSAPSWSRRWTYLKRSRKHRYWSDLEKCREQRYWKGRTIFQVDWDGKTQAHIVPEMIDQVAWVLERQCRKICQKCSRRRCQKYSYTNV